MYNMQELHLILFSLFLLLQQFQYILLLVYQLIFFYTYNFYNLNILQHRIIITFTLTITRIPNISSITSAFINQFFTFTAAFIIIPNLFIITNTCIQSIYTLTRFMSFYVSCFISSWYQIEYLNIYIFTASGTHMFPYGSLILLQLPLHLLVLILKG